MKTPRLKPFKAWVASPVGALQPCVRHERWLCSADCATGQSPVRVVVRDAREDRELLARLAATENVATDCDTEAQMQDAERKRLKRENARLRRLFRRTHKALVGGWYGEACELIAEELERRDRR